MPIAERRRAALLGVFRDESAELVRTLGRALLSLEDAAAPADRARLFGEIGGTLHTLKGSSAIVGLGEIAGLIHELETAVLAVGRAPPADLSPLVSGVLGALDVVPVWTRRAAEGKPVAAAELEELVRATRALGALAATAGSSAAAPPSSGAAPASVAAQAVPSSRGAEAPPPDTARAGTQEPRDAGGALEVRALRVSTERLDAVLAQAEDLAVGVARLRHRIDGISAVEGQLEQLLQVRAGAQGPRAGDGALAAELGRVHQRLGASAWDVSTDAERLATAAGTLLEELRAMRMLPASTLFETLARPCRDWARALDKRVEVELRGGDVRLDKRVLEALKAPLVHLLRNAVAHGLEAPEERAAAGKSRAGRIVLAAESRGHRVALVVSDDGRGVDVGAVRVRAVREHLVSEAVAADLGDEAVLELIFREGFSTRTEATPAAGRGVGLSVVRDAVERLRGQVTVVSTLGFGTTFTLDVPLTVAATRGLVVSAGGELYALPLAGVERVARLPLAEVRQLHGVPSAQIEAGPVRLVSLAALLDRKELPLRPGDGGTLQVVVLAAGRRRLAVTVDVILGERPMILKDLPGPLRTIGVLAGATVLDDGRVAPVLDLEGLVAEGLAGALGGDETARRRTTVRRALVVDDSVTTRMLVAGELGALGYRVVTAADGLQALGALEAEPFDVLVTDANMPNMDGFDLTRSVRASPRLAHLPVVLLTSADGQADQLRGVEVGADAYVIKKDFVRESMGSLLDQLLRRSATP